MVGCLSLLLGLGATSCGDDENDDNEQTVVDPSNQEGEDNGGENNGGNPTNGEKNEIDEFIKSIKLFSTKTDAEKFDQYLAMIPAGIYEFNEQNVFVKCNDGGAFIIDKKGMKETSNIIGNNIYNMSYGYDGNMAGYMLYHDEGKPAYHKYEYTSKKEMLANAIEHSEFLHKFYKYLEQTFCFYMLSSTSYYGEEFKLHSEDADLHGIPCKHYYITSDAGNYELVVGNALRSGSNVADFYISEEGFILKYTTTQADWVELVNYTPFDGNFEEGYKKVTELYGVLGAQSLNSCIKSYKKYANEWPASLLPSNLPYLAKYNGKIFSYDVSYHNSDDYNGFVSIEIVADQSTAIEEFRKYASDVKALGLCTIHDEADILGQLSLEISNWGCTSPDLGETLIYPGYEINFSDFNVGLMTKRIRYNLNWVTGV